MLVLNWLQSVFDTVEFVDGWQPIYNGPDDIAYWEYYELSYRLTKGDFIVEVFAPCAKTLYRLVYSLLREQKVL